MSCQTEKGPLYLRFFSFKCKITIVKEKHQNKIKKIIPNNLYLIVAVIVIAAAIGFGGYQIYSLNQEIQRTTSKLNQTEEELFQSNKENEELTQNLERVESNRDMLAQSLKDEKSKNEEFQKQINQIASTVGDLEKLNEIDPEILKKYSKTFFLNEHYVPSSLSMIEPKYLYYENDPEQIHSKVKPFLHDMLEDAKDDGIEIYVRSAYRSFGIQSNLKSNYVVTYGEDTANKFSAEQGYSEHQLGTTVDLITTGINGTLEGFGNTEAAQWLKNNAYKYGFTMSYPEGNEYYYYEPWHWRFVGRDLARYLHTHDKEFYDMEQRKIDEYLINIFE